MHTEKELREIHKAERDNYVASIISSPARKRIIAAGPGTGKTFLFAEICKNLDGEKLILTFINELVNDIRKEIGNLAEVRTLHSFAGKLLKASLYMELTELIEEDFKLYFGRTISFKEIFSRLLQGFDNELKFYSKRRQYYHSFGPLCVIYALIKVLESNPQKIPLYSQILVDEIQDFNQLEIQLIDTLAKKNSILVVGDDDQALYSFKYAGPTEIRKCYKDGSHEPFELPYCSRCTEVLVNAANQFIQQAKEKGFLKDRIDKPYKYFHSENKDEVSVKNPRILLKKPVFRNQVAAYIDSQLRDLAEEDNNFSVFVICTLPNQVAPLADALMRRGFRNIERPPEHAHQTKRAAYENLLEDERDNLGWRLIAGDIFNQEQLREMVRISVEKEAPFYELIPEEEKVRVLKIVNILKKLKENGQISKQEAQIILEDLEIDPVHIALNQVKESLFSSSVSRSSYKNILIKIVTMLGAKGLTRDYVFLVNCDDRFMLNSGIITDENICRFLVALTRARKRLIVFSSTHEIPKFLQWIGEDSYENI